MATDDTTQPYPEDDKLGPLGANAPVFTDDARLRAVLLAEFRTAVDTARRAATDAGRVSDATAAATAVHDYRKALRQARAVLDLAAGALAKGEASTLRRALRDARRSVSSVRDHAVAPAALAGLPLGAEDRATADAILAAASAAVPSPAEIAQLLASGAASAQTQAEALEAALPHALEWSAVAASLAGIYRTARRARRRGKRSRRAFHAWRRRTKELAYQLELLARHAGPRVAKQRDRLAAISDRLGPAVDLVMLREYVATHAAAVTPEALANLRLAIDAALGDLMRSTRQGSRPAFDLGGRKLARKVTRAIRRDLAPATPDAASPEPGAPGDDPDSRQPSDGDHVDRDDPHFDPAHAADHPAPTAT
jgi:CHAD domain-containing protein